MDNKLTVGNMNKMLKKTQRALEEGIEDKAMRKLILAMHNLLIGYNYLSAPKDLVEGTKEEW